MNMNVKKSKSRNFDKQNICQSMNKISGNRNAKKVGKTGQQIRRKMLTDVGMTYSRIEPYQSLKINNDYMNKPQRKRGLHFSGIRRSTDYVPALQTSRSTKSVKFQQKFDDFRLSRKHSTNSILKSKSNLKKSNISDRGSMKSSICSNIGRQNQSNQNSSVNRIIREKYQNFLQNLSKNNSKYTDELYPPLSCSLHHKKNEDQYKNITWMRIGQVFSGKHLNIYNRQPCQSYITGKSQALVTCFNTIKHNSFLLQKIFESQTYAKHGIYLLKINQNSNWKYIIIDDYIPVVMKQQGYVKRYEPAFLKYHKINSKSSEVEIWPFLLQKAYAKYYGTYSNLKEVNEIDFLQQLTCCPVEQIDVREDNMNYIIQEMKNFDTIMMCRTKDYKFKPIIPRKMQISVENIENIADGGHSVKSYEQEYFIRKYQKIYCLTLHKYFYTGCCTIKQYNKSDKAQPMSLRYFKLQQKTQCVLSVIQKDIKHYQNGYQYCWVRMIIAQKQSQKNYRWIGGIYEKNKSLKLKLDLQSGQYYVLIHPQWKNQPFDINLVMYSNSICQLERKSYLGNENILVEAAMDHAQRNGKMKQLNSNICTYTYIQRNLGLIIQNINNERPSGHIRILRSVQGLQKNKKYKIKAFNKQFKFQHTIQVKIQSLQHFTVVLGLLGGINQHFLNQFDFGS